MPLSHNGIAPGLRPGPFGASPFDSGQRRFLIFLQNKNADATQGQRRLTNFFSKEVS